MIKKVKEKNDKDDNIERGFKLKDIFNYFQNQLKPELTKTQKRRNERGIMNSIQLLNFKLKTRIAISDFKDKISRNTISTYGNCTLCNKRLNSLHLFKECTVTKLWESKLGFRDHCLQRREESFIDTKPIHLHKMNAMWITNWSIWKTYNKVRFEEINKEDAQYTLREIIRNEEHRFLISNKEIPKEFTKMPQTYFDMLTEYFKYRTINKEQKIISKD